MATAGDIDVYVKMPSEHSAQYDVKSCFTIKLLCGLIAKDENIPATQVRLKYQGKTLDGTKSVGWYGVRPETILKVDVSCILFVEFQTVLLFYRRLLIHINEVATILFWKIKIYSLIYFLSLCKKPS